MSWVACAKIVEDAFRNSSVRYDEGKERFSFINPDGGIDYVSLDFVEIMAETGVEIAQQVIDEITNAR